MGEYEQFAQAVHNFWQEIARLLHMPEICEWLKKRLARWIK